MINGANQEINEIKAPVTTDKSVVRPRSLRLSIGVHSMPKTSAGNLKLWFILGGVTLVLFAIIIFLVLN
ncbi:MAG TPA: hypothetical protein VFD16_03630 [Candidatus Saccharimonadales bacterium]|nr:hypothetical protein [Candidatus Saccharimonadales bacterium]